jgi:hypothetical protein
MSTIIFCGSKMFHPDPEFSIPDPGSGSKRHRIPYPDAQQRILSFLTQIIVSQVLEIWSEIFIPDQDFFMPDPVSRIRIPDSGVKKHSSPCPYPQRRPQQWSGRIWICKKYLRIRKNGFQVMSEEEFPNFY